MCFHALSMQMDDQASEVSCWDVEESINLAIFVVCNEGQSLIKQFFK